jgi:hypothetical protein
VVATRRGLRGAGWLTANRAQSCRPTIFRR